MKSVRIEDPVSVVHLELVCRASLELMVRIHRNVADLDFADRPVINSPREAWVRFTRHARSPEMTLFERPASSAADGRGVGGMY
jgi:hypothetical protein